MEKYEKEINEIIIDYHNEIVATNIYNKHIDARILAVSSLKCLFESLLKEQEKEYNQNIEELIDIITDMELSKTKPFAIPKNRRGIKNYYLKKYKLLSEKE